jgi:DNA-binding NtrC family response regulator
MKKVLFLDDDKNLCHLMVELFEESKDVEVSTVNNYSELISFADNIQKFDVIFLDVNLGEGPSGLDAFEWLKKMNFEKRIIFLSGHAQSYPQIRNAIAMPNVYFLAKPAQIKQIEDHINA